MSKTWLIAVILFLALSLPLVVYVTQQTQEIRQRAAPYPSASPALPPPGPRCGSSHFICTWNRNSPERYFMICEWPESGNGNDGIGRQGQSTSGDIGLCQEKQDDSQYCNLADCNCAPGDPRPKRITWTAKGPRGVSCSYTYDFCRAGEPGYNGEHAGDCSSTELNPPPPPANPLLWNWNFNECAKCTGGALVDWNLNGNGTVKINSITAQNYRALLQPVDDPNIDGSPNDTKVKTGSGGFDSRSKLDYRIQILDTTNPAAPVVLKTETIFNGDSRITCTYPTTDSYCTRDSANHRVDCTLGNYTISGLTFVPGRTYSLKTWIKLGYADDTAWIDYVADASGNVNRNICNSNYTVPAASPSPTPSPTPTPPPGEVVCQVKEAFLNNVFLPDGSLVSPGDPIDFRVTMTPPGIVKPLQVIDVVPTGLTIQSATAEGGGSCSIVLGNRVNCNVPSSNSVIIIQTVVAPTATGTMVNTATVAPQTASSATFCSTSVTVPSPTPTPSPRPSPSPSPSPTPTPSPLAMCRAVRLYRLVSSSICSGNPTDSCSWDLISDNPTELRALRSGQTVYATIWGDVTNGTIDRGRIRMNPAPGQLWTTGDETANVKPASSPIEYYKQFTLPSGTINFRFEGEVHEVVTNKWY